MGPKFNLISLRPIVVLATLVLLTNLNVLSTSKNTTCICATIPRLDKVELAGSGARQLSSLEPFIEDRAKQLGGASTNDQTGSSQNAESSSLTQAAGQNRGRSLYYGATGAQQQQQVSYGVGGGSSYGPAPKLEPLPVGVSQPYGGVVSETKPALAYGGATYQHKPSYLAHVPSIVPVLELTKPGIKIYTTAGNQKYHRKPTVRRIIHFKDAKEYNEQLGHTKVFEPEFYIQEETEAATTTTTTSTTTRKPTAKATTHVPKKTKLPSTGTIELPPATPPPEPTEQPGEVEEEAAAVKEKVVDKKAAKKKDAQKKAAEEKEAKEKEAADTKRLELEVSKIEQKLKAEQDRIGKLFGSFGSLGSLSAPSGELNLELAQGETNGAVSEQLQQQQQQQESGQDGEQKQQQQQQQQEVDATGAEAGQEQQQQQQQQQQEEAPSKARASHDEEPGQDEEEEDEHHDDLMTAHTRGRVAKPPASLFGDSELDEMAEHVGDREDFLGTILRNSKADREAMAAAKKIEGPPRRLLEPTDEVDLDNGQQQQQQQQQQGQKKQQQQQQQQQKQQAKTGARAEQAPGQLDILQSLLSLVFNQGQGAAGQRPASSGTKTASSSAQNTKTANQPGSPNLLSLFGLS